MGFDVKKERETGWFKAEVTFFLFEQPQHNTHKKGVTPQDSRIRIYIVGIYALYSKNR